MGYFNWWSFPKKAWLIILTEFVVISALSAWLYATYLNDVYFQSYTNSLVPIMVPILSVAFGISSATIAAYLYLGMKRIQPQAKLETHSKKRIGTPPATKQQSQNNDLRAKAPDLSRLATGQLKPLTPHRARNSGTKSGSLTEHGSQPEAGREKSET